MSAIDHIGLFLSWMQIFRGGSTEEFHQWWYVHFDGETGMDWGRLFRTTISDINDELVSTLP